MLRVGTDCSGMEAPVQALRNLGILHRHVFSYDTDPACGATVCANFAPERAVFGPAADITARDPQTVPAVDLYVCGFPCQPFSKCGTQAGFADPRGTVFHGCVAYLRHHRPKHFVLENVRTLLTHDHGRTWATVWHTLREALPEYALSHEVLRTAAYGIPQSRQRLYLVGVRDGPPFVFPAPIPAPRPQAAYVQPDAPDDPSDQRGSQRANALALTPLLRRRGCVFVDVLQYRSAERVPQAGLPLCTCLLCTSFVWCTPERRWATNEELLALQGFPVDFAVVVPPSKFRKQVGNAMSVNVLEHLFAALYGVPPPDARGRYRQARA